jgi:lysophospholipase-2
MLSSKLDHIKFILPTAPTQPVTLNMGMPMASWYDIVGLDDRASETCTGLAESRARIEGILAGEHAAGVQYDRMILAGFSQGGALSLYTGMQMQADKKLAGVVVMSGQSPFSSKPIFTHCLSD